MALFQDREQAFEQTFVHDEEARFRALARRNKLLRQWAATQLGLTGQKADAHVGENTCRRMLWTLFHEHVDNEQVVAGVHASEKQLVLATIR